MSPSNLCTMSSYLANFGKPRPSAPTPPCLDPHPSPRHPLHEPSPLDPGRQKPNIAHRSALQHVGVLVRSTLRDCDGELWYWLCGRANERLVSPPRKPSREEEYIRLYSTSWTTFSFSSPCSGTGARSRQLREGCKGWLRRRTWVRRNDSLRLITVYVAAILAEWWAITCCVGCDGLRELI